MNEIIFKDWSTNELVRIEISKISKIDIINCERMKIYLKDETCYYTEEEIIFT